MPSRLPALLAVIGLATFASAQDTTPTFTSKSDLVVVPTVVSKGGSPLTGLHKQDFVLMHDGKAEPIAEFEEVEALPAKMELAPLPPHTVQNFAAASNHQDVVVLLLDFLNGSRDTANFMRSYIKDMTDQFAAARTPVTVLLLTQKGLLQIHSFTSSPENLTKTVEQWTARGSTLGDDNASPAWKAPAGSSWANPMMVTSPVEGGQTLSQYAQMPGFTQRSLDRGRMTAQAVEDIAQAFRGIPGRKKLIWMSIGFPHGLAMTPAMGEDVPTAGQLANPQQGSSQQKTYLRPSGLPHSGNMLGTRLATPTSWCIPLTATAP